MISALVAAVIAGQASSLTTSTFTIRIDEPGALIHREIYGQFAEHLGNCVYGGIWVGPESKIPNTRGIRKDVVQALKEINAPVVRWPGGCFADRYHWEDGIGSSSERPRRLNVIWGGTDTNAFGTHEFLDFCEQIGAEPYISCNVGSGSPYEAQSWLEYMTSDSDSTFAQLRRKNGRSRPWKVPFYAIGNECWGCGGEMTAEHYADVLRNFSTFIGEYSGNKIERIACGPNSDDYGWTEIVMKDASFAMQGLSVHYYTLPTGDWSKKGSATNFDEVEWAQTFAETLRMEDMIRHHSAVMDRYDPGKKIGLIVDEWGTWYDPNPKEDFGALSQQNTLRDALVAALNFNIFNRHCDRVRMANVSQLANVLQSVVLTRGDKMVRTPTYWVFDLYKIHQNATLLPVDGDPPLYRIGNVSLPSLSLSASKDGNGHIHISIANIDPNHESNVSVSLPGVTVSRVSGRQLTAPLMDACNTFERPDLVRPSAFTAFEVHNGAIKAKLPPKSVVVLEIGRSAPSAAGSK